MSHLPRNCLYPVKFTLCGGLHGTLLGAGAASQKPCTMGSPEWRTKIDELYKSFASGDADGKRWARPDAPILNSLPDEKAEPHVFFHNSNYRISRKYINAEKVKASASPRLVPATCLMA